MSLMEERYMSAGYVLVRTGVSDVSAVRDKLLNVSGVVLVHPLSGSDQLICYVDTYEPWRFRSVLNQGIRSALPDGEIETETLIIMADGGSGYSGEENRPAPASAWLLCKVAVADPETVIKELGSIKAVKNAHPVLGRYDMVAYVEASSEAELTRALDEIRQVKGMKSIDPRTVSIWSAAGAS